MLVYTLGDVVALAILGTATVVALLGLMWTGTKLAITKIKKRFKI